jgi:hypothetical protein
MASKAQVTLNGRFSPGTAVELVEVADESVLTGAGGKVVDRKKVDRDGRVQFQTGVTAGGRYFIRGLQDGMPLEVRARGNADADADVGFQRPVQPDRVRLSDGSWADEAPEERRRGSVGSGRRRRCSRPAVSGSGRTRRAATRTRWRSRSGRRTRGRTT